MRRMKPMKVSLGLVVVGMASTAAMAAWTPSGGGEYTNNGNWAGGTIDGQFTESGGSYTGANIVTFNADTTLSSGLNFNYAGSGSFQLSATGVTSTAVTWTSANTFTLASPLAMASADVVQLTSGSPVPANQAAFNNGGWQSGFYVLSAPGSTLTVRSTPSGGVLTFDASATNSNAVFKSRVVTLGGNITFNATDTGSQTLTIGAANGSTDAVSLRLNGDRTINVSAGDTVVIRNVISQTSGGNRKLIKSGAGTLELGTGTAVGIFNSSFTGGVDLNAGTLRLTSSSEANVTPTRGVLGSAATGTGTIRANGGGLEFINQQDVRNAIVLAADLPVTADYSLGAFSLQLNGNVSGTGNLVLDAKGTIAVAGAPQIRLRAAYTYTGNVVVTNHLTQNPGTNPFAVILEKALPGNVTVSGTNIANGESQLLWNNNSVANVLPDTATVTLNDYSQMKLGTVSDAIGKLVVNDTHNANVILDPASSIFLGTVGTANGKIQLRNGGTLAGSGIVDAGVLVNEAGGTVIAGSAVAGAGGTTGTLTMSAGLVADSSVSFKFNFNGSANVSTLALTSAGDDLTPLSGLNTVTLFDLGGGPLSDGTYTLISGIETGSLSDFSLAALPAGWSGSLAYDSGNLNFVVPEPSMLGCVTALGLFLARKRRQKRNVTVAVNGGGRHVG